MLINNINSSIMQNSSENDEEILKIIGKVIKEFDINVSYLDELIPLLKELIQNLKRKNLSSNLISLDWQLSIVERENEKTSVSLNKFDKVEVIMQFKTIKENEYNKNIIKMGYNEFYEIFQNLKKIDGQLHMFKN
jgi:hypothetical protein